MSDEKVMTEHDIHTNEFLAMPVIKDSELMAAEFPEFIFGLAEENFLRGYQTGLNDAENLHRTTTETTD